MQTVFVGLSGGVDSAVSAALLKEQGYNVVGAFIKIWRPEFIECPWQKERLDAMRVAAHLGIPFKEIDLSEEYKKEVIDDMVGAYMQGRTPNPDVLCNRHIKFGAFKRWAVREGADMIATGHYAQTSGGKLFRGIDPNKDQSYFLARLSSHDLAATLFPVGGYTKPQVRALAAKFNLPVAGKKDSQGLCFVGDVSMRDFLSRYVSLTKGPVLDEGGNIVGEHDGAALYTLGERHGFRNMSRSPDERPQYVVATDVIANTITVSPHRARAERDHIALRDFQWTHSAQPLPYTSLIQVRYRETPIPSTIKEIAEGYEAVFERPQIAPAGQIAAVYDGEELVASALIG